MLLLLLLFACLKWRHAYFDMGYTIINNIHEKITQF